MVRKRTFREDLFYRLNVVRLFMPPLRERQEDIPVLLDYFIAEYSRENGVSPVTLEPGAMKRLLAYRWPGNIRELRNFAENVVIMQRGSRITEYDLDPKFTREEEGARTVSGEEFSPAPNRSFLVEDNEKRLLRTALLEARGNRTRAAELMGVSRRTLHRKLARWPDLDVVDR